MGITGVTVLPGFYDTAWEPAFDLVAAELSPLRRGRRRWGAGRLDRAARRLGHRYA